MLKVQSLNMTLLAAVQNSRYYYKEKNSPFKFLRDVLRYKAMCYGLFKIYFS